MAEAASTICGIPLPVPFFRSIKPSIKWTITAGETAANTAPNTADSSQVRPSNGGPSNVMARPSMTAGTMARSSTRPPTCRKDSRLTSRPARSKIMISAPSRSSSDNAMSDGLIQPKRKGPPITPTINKPTNPGTATRRNAQSMSTPMINKMAIAASIDFQSPGTAAG